MSIRTNIESVIAQVQANSTIGDDLQQKSIAAIKAGENSPEWEDYMKTFAQTETELARLCAQDTTQGDFAFDVARTYLVGNGVCGPVTIDRLAFGIDDKLDEGLS